MDINIQKNDSASHNLDVLSKKEELRQYLKCIFYDWFSK